jgi:hypothetical protein
MMMMIGLMNINYTMPRKEVIVLTSELGVRIAEVCESVSYDGPGWPYSIFHIT